MTIHTDHLGSYIDRPNFILSYYYRSLKSVSLYKTTDKDLIKNPLFPNYLTGVWHVKYKNEQI